MSGGNKTVQTQTQQASPYAGATPLLNTGLKDALSLYKGGKLNPYTPTSTETRGGLIGMQRAAGNAIGPLNQALSTFRGASTGNLDVSSQGQMGIRNSALAPSYSEKNLADVASGKLINQSDPNYDRLRERAMQDASTEAGMIASGMGRTGSDYHQSAVGSRVADTVGGMDYKRLQDERSRQVEANSLMDAMRQAGLGLGLNAQNSASATQAANQDRRLGAAEAIPGMVEATYDPYKKIMGVGQQYDADRAARAGAPGMNLSSLMQILGIASPYGSSTGSTQQPNNRLGQIAGGGLSLASLLSMM